MIVNYNTDVSSVGVVRSRPAAFDDTNEVQTRRQLPIYGLSH